MPVIQATSIASVREAVDKKGRIYYWCYSVDYENENCRGCLAGTCLQRVAWYLDGEGVPDEASVKIVHNCEKELS